MIRPDDPPAAPRAEAVPEGRRSDDPASRALTALRAGRPDDCLAVVDEASSALPRSTGDYLRGLALALRGDKDAAVLALGSAVEARPEWLPARYNLARALSDLGRWQDAAREYETVLASQPQQADAAANLANCRLALGDAAGALDASDLALAAQTDHPGATATRIEALVALGRLTEALQSGPSPDCTSAPRPVPATLNLASALTAAGRAQAAYATLAQELERLGPDADANLVMQLAALSNYVTDDPDAIADAHRAIPFPAPRPVAALPSGPTDPDRPLRVGLLSPDLREHSVAWFLLPWLSAVRNHTIAYVAVSCSHPPSGHARQDPITTLLRGATDGWVEIGAVDDDAAVEALRDARIDILVDLAGLTNGNRNSLLCRRPAPVIVEWLGYPTATGNPATAWRLTDSRFGPGLGRSADLVLPIAHCYGPPPIQIEPAPAHRRPGPMFGSFNSLVKLTHPAVALWSSLLQALPGSALTLKDRALTDPGVRAEVTDRFARKGIAPHRLRLLGRDGTAADHLARYDEIDVALDPTPYGGATTTCEALWMGVPVVTLRARTPAGGLAASMLAAAGLDEWIADDPEGYLALARRLADARHRHDRLALRRRMLQSDLCNGAGFAATLARAFRFIWQGWCAGDVPANTDLTATSAQHTEPQ